MQRWEFINENKKVRKKYAWNQAIDQEKIDFRKSDNGQEKSKIKENKAHSRPGKRQRKK